MDMKPKNKYILNINSDIIIINAWKKRNINWKKNKSFN